MSFYGQEYVPDFIRSPELKEEIHSSIYSRRDPFVERYLTDSRLNLDDLDLDSPRLSPSRISVSPLRISPHRISRTRLRSRSPLSFLHSRRSRKQPRLNIDNITEEQFEKIRLKVDQRRLIYEQHKKNFRISTAYGKLVNLQNRLKNLLIEKEEYIEDRINKGRRIIRNFDNQIILLQTLIQEKLKDIELIENQEIILPLLSREEYINIYNRLYARK